MQLSYSLRKIRQKPEQFIIIALCFSLFLTFITLCLAIGDYVLRDRPVWVEQGISLITLGKTGADGGFLPVSQQDVESLSHVSGIKKVESMSLMMTMLETEYSEKKNEVQVALFSSGIGSILAPGIAEKFSEAGDKRLIWLSHAFWDKQFQQKPVLEQEVYLGSDRTVFTVAGILPESMNYIGGSSVDILLADEYLTKLLPITIQLPPNMDLATKEQVIRQGKRAISQKMEIRFGLAIIDSKTSIEQISQDFQALNKPVDNDIAFTMLGEGLNYWFVPGMQFTPEVKQNLKNQWWLLLTLVIFFGILAIVNLAGFASNQFIERQQEIIIRLTSGAKTFQLCQQFFLESMPLLITVVAMTIGFLSTIYVFFADHSALISFLGGPLAAPSPLVVVLSISIIILSIFGANILPILYGLKVNLFTRQTGNGEDLHQQHSRMFVTFIQLLIAGVSVYMSCYFISAQWQQKTLDGFDFTLEEYNIRQASGKILSNTLILTLQQKLGKEVAFSGSRFVDPNAGRELVFWSGENVNNGIRILRIPVSANYFNLLQPNIIIEGQLNQQNVIINQAALTLLSKDKSGQEVLGKSLIIGENNMNSKQVVGVVSNLPHYGQQNLNVPVIYTLYNNSMLLDGYLLLNNKEALGTSVMPDIEIKAKGTLQMQISKLDQQRIWFIFMSLALLSILMLSAIFTLYYQIKATLRKQYLNFGTLLALGSPDKKILTQSIRQFYLPYFNALTGLIIFWLLALNHQGLELLWQSVAYLSLSIIILTLVMLVLVLLVFREVISTSISELVRYHN
jgi:ABC-type antimicrobial peptide transport system permease subunit